ncbi:MAG: HSPB1-associated protein 1 [Paramarteilia canceri]
MSSKFSPEPTASFSIFNPNDSESSVGSNSLQTPILFRSKEQLFRDEAFTKLVRSSTATNDARLAKGSGYLRLFSPSKLAKRFGKRSVKVIVGLKSLYEIEWPERQSTVEVTFEEYKNWLGGSTKDVGKLSKYPKTKYWAYLSYVRAFELVANDKQYLNCEPWSQCFPRLADVCSKTGNDINIWYGSEGSYTPCHFDSYGFNLVFQTSGRKMWILFPPESYQKMQATRLPYEETSIFSAVNVLRPQKEFSKSFQSASSCIIILNPGDVLYVPKHWWHYAEALTNSLSINCWFDLECDRTDRLKEIFTSIHINSIINNLSIREEGMIKLFKMSMDSKKHLKHWDSSKRKSCVQEENAIKCCCSLKDDSKTNPKPFYKKRHIPCINLANHLFHKIDLKINVKNIDIPKIIRNSKQRSSNTKSRGSILSTTSVTQLVDMKSNVVLNNEDVEPVVNFINAFCDYCHLDRVIADKYSSLND